MGMATGFWVFVHSSRLLSMFWVCREFDPLSSFSFFFGSWEVVAAADWIKQWPKQAGREGKKERNEMSCSMSGKPSAVILSHTIWEKDLCLPLLSMLTAYVCLRCHHTCSVFFRIIVLLWQHNMLGLAFLISFGYVLSSWWSQDRACIGVVSFYILLCLVL